MSDVLEPAAIYDSAAVARLLFQHDVEWFYSYRKTTGRTERFPAPISGKGHPRWSGAALIAWRDRPGRGVDLTLLVPSHGGNVLNLTDELRRRSLAMAAAGPRHLSR